MGAYGGDTKVEPLEVRVANPGDIKPPGPRNKRYRAVYETIILNASDPVKQLLPASDTREIAYILPLDFDVVIGKDNGTVQAGANTAQSPATPSFPSGALIPKALTYPYPVCDTGAVLVAATNLAATSRVTVTAYHCDY